MTFEHFFFGPMPPTPPKRCKAQPAFTFDPVKFDVGTVVEVHEPHDNSWRRCTLFRSLSRGSRAVVLWFSGTEYEGLEVDYTIDTGGVVRDGDGDIVATRPITQPAKRKTSPTYAQMIETALASAAQEDQPGSTEATIRKLICEAHPHLEASRVAVYVPPALKKLVASGAVATMGESKPMGSKRMVIQPDSKVSISRPSVVYSTATRYRLHPTTKIYSVSALSANVLAARSIEIARLTAQTAAAESARSRVALQALANQARSLPRLVHRASESTTQQLEGLQAGMAAKSEYITQLEQPLRAADCNYTAAHSKALVKVTKKLTTLSKQVRDTLPLIMDAVSESDNLVAELHRARASLASDYNKTNPKLVLIAEDTVSRCISLLPLSYHRLLCLTSKAMGSCAVAAMRSVTAIGMNHKYASWQMLHLRRVLALIQLCPHLKHCMLGPQHMSSHVLDALARCSRTLMTVKLTGNSTHYYGPNFGTSLALNRLIDKSSSLQVFHCQAKGLVSGELLKAIANCKHLIELVLPRADLPDALVSLITTKCTQLQTLDISNSNISRLGLRQIALKLVKLHTLRVGNCQAVTDGGLDQFYTGTTSLKALDIRQCQEITVSAFSSLCARCPDLTVCVINYTKADDAWLTALADGCKKLTHLWLDGCGQVGDVGLCAIAQNCPLLSRLSITDCSGGLTADAIGGLSACPQLQKFYCGKVHCIAAAPLQHFFASCPQLRTLDFSFCPNFDGACLKLLEPSASLRSLSIRGCSSLRDVDVLSFVSHAKSCKKMKLLDIRNCELYAAVTLIYFTAQTKMPKCVLKYDHYEESDLSEDSYDY